MLEELTELDELLSVDVLEVDKLLALLCELPETELFEELELLLLERLTELVE